MIACSGKKDPVGPMYLPTQPIVLKDWKFETKPSFAEEFDYTGKPDPAKWGYDVGGSGWGNNELEYYTDNLSNAGVANGKLTITARKEEIGNRNITSARLVTKNKADFLYGRFEISAKLPSGKGTWPAIWMLPTDWVYGGWPQSGEIDIMEHVGYEQDVVHITTHCEAYYFKINTQKTSTKKIDGVSTAFHKYRVDWTPDAIRGFIDDQMIFETFNENKGPKYWPFDKRFHILLNLAIGGDWGGAKGVDDNIFPASMEVDYVRVYKLIEQ
ncbi:family 16 glycosylhydrolase [Pedobacter sp. HMF7056]|uniref:Family 16 glycosylhydrolase n=2 Tax=Hufsiella ginkgonis TaxID=2695274 RepID=A0A7K1Y1G6_9SPHI|nr:glycoside hydrolase family 16 protein [Hufsiella ginkgonis]MXV17093.1 family 16 glycosylhydrolase [Hufsiella ginkgonis]